MKEDAAEANLYMELEGRLHGRSSRELIAQIVYLAQATDPTTLLLCVSLLTMLGTAGAPLAPSPAVMEHLALFLLPLTISPPTRPPTPAELMEASDLLNLAFVAFLYQEGGELDVDDPSSLITHSASTYRDSYRATGYDFQTEAEIQGVQGHLDAWFAGRLGLRPSRTLALLRAMETLSEERLRPMIEAANEAGNLAARR